VVFAKVFSTQGRASPRGLAVGGDNNIFIGGAALTPTLIVAFAFSVCAVGSRWFA